MARPTRTRLLLLVCSLVLGAAMVAPASASGALTITQSGTVVKISDPSGSPFDLTITLSPDASYLAIISSSGIADPLPPGCTRISANHIRCPEMTIGRIEVVGGAFGDSLNVVDQSFLGRLPFIDVEAGAGDDTASVVGMPQGTLCDMGDGDDYCIGGRETPTTCTMGNGNDTCIGGGSRDTCDMGAGRDVCSTGAERDSCSAGKGRDVCRMGPDPDVCRMGPDRDVCQMGGGSDTCIGGGGIDSCFGSGGNDRGKSCEHPTGIEHPRMPPSPH